MSASLLAHACRAPTSLRAGYKVLAGPRPTSSGGTLFGRLLHDLWSSWRAAVVLHVSGKGSSGLIKSSASRKWLLTRRCGRFTPPQAGH